MLREAIVMSEGSGVKITVVTQIFSLRVVCGAGHELDIRI